MNKYHCAHMKRDLYQEIYRLDRNNKWLIFACVSQLVIIGLLVWWLTSSIVTG